MKKSNFKFFFIFISALVIVSFGCSKTPNVKKVLKPAENASSFVMLQGFSWESSKQNKQWWNILASRGEQIGSTFDYVWFPPCSDSSADNGYLPRQLFKFSSAFGTEDELKAAITAIKPAKPIADLVINHRVGTNSWGDFTNPDWEMVFAENYKAICYNDEGFSSEDAMSSVPMEMRGKLDTGDSFIGGRDLDHTNPVVRQGVIEYMQLLKEKFGFVGFRFDYCKGYAPEYVGYYNSLVENELSVGEYWVNDTKRVKNWVKGTEKSIGDGFEKGKKTMAFDFVLKGFLNHVFGKTDGAENKYYGLLGSKDTLYKEMPEYAVTFVENHDTGSTQGHWPIDNQDLGTAYAFILTHPGIPCVAYQHYFTGDTSDCVGSTIVPGTEITLQEHIDYLVKLRKACGIENTSEVEILETKPAFYQAIIKGTKANVLISLGNGEISVPKGYKKLHFGQDFVIWSNL